MPVHCDEITRITSFPLAANFSQAHSFPSLNRSNLHLDSQLLWKMMKLNMTAHFPLGLLCVALLTGSLTSFIGAGLMDTEVHWDLEGCLTAGNNGTMPLLYKHHMLELLVQNLTFVKFFTLNFCRFYFHIAKFHMKWIFAPFENFPLYGT